MRTCEAGACTQPAVYRGPRDEKGAAAWCEEHVWKEYDAAGFPTGALAPGITPIRTEETAP
jgi:hypothetical protein